jgi:hypothetical protein
VIEVRLLKAQLNKIKNGETEPHYLFGLENQNISIKLPSNHSIITQMKKVPNVKSLLLKPKEKP